MGEGLVAPHFEAASDTAGVIVTPKRVVRRVCSDRAEKPKSYFIFRRPTPWHIPILGA